MILDDGNALIFLSKFFLPTAKTRPTIRQISSLLISKEKPRDSNFPRLRHLSPTIGQFFASSIAERILCPDEKRPSAPYRFFGDTRNIGPASDVVSPMRR